MIWLRDYPLGHLIGDDGAQAMNPGRFHDQLMQY